VDVGGIVAVGEGTVVAVRVGGTGVRVAVEVSVVGVGSAAGSDGDRHPVTNNNISEPAIRNLDISVSYQSLCVEGI
jgi:hypothetical protein